MSSRLRDCFMCNTFKKRSTAEPRLPWSYVCPAGAELTHRFNTYELGSENRYYQARVCRSCALKKQCTRNKANRKITREENEGLMEAMAARMQAQQEKFKLKKTLAEHPFGTIKCW